MDAFSTFSGQEYTLGRVKELLPNLKELFMSSDNAPNYHCNEVLLSYVPRLL